MSFFGRAHGDLGPIFARQAVNDERFRGSEAAQESVLLEEHRALETRLLLKLARGTFRPDVWIAGTASGRHHVIDALADHPRLLVVGGRWSGKSNLAGFVLVRAARRDVRFTGNTPLSVQVSRMSGSSLDEAEITRLNPAAGRDLVQSALECGSALVVVDGLDEAESPGELKRSIEALARRYPGARFLVTTRPLPPKIPGKSESTMEGFLSVRLAGSEAGRGTVLELDAARSPAERAARAHAETARLLDLWSLDRLPPGSALGRLTEQGRLLLLCDVASHAYDNRMIEISDDALAAEIRTSCEHARWFEDTGQLLHADEQPLDGEPYEDLDDLARRMIEDIARCPGALVQKQPGVFGFADLAVQQCLTAMHFVKNDYTFHLLELRDDPWWQPVLVLAAGLPAPFSSKMPARRLIGDLLEASAGADSIATFLAAHLAEVAPALPASLRDEIDRRMRLAMPPRSSIQASHIAGDIGEIAAPALLAALDGAGPNERAFIITALGRLNHPGAVRAIARYAGDQEPTTEDVLCWFWNVDPVFLQQPVGFFAFAAIFNLALSSPAALGLFDQVLAKTPHAALETFMRIVAFQIIDDEHWGTEPEEERDAGHADALLQKVIAAYARRAPR